jgi:hypothetical protein
MIPSGYNTPFKSGIREEFIALQSDLEISVDISILKEYNIYKEVFKRREIELYLLFFSM